MEQSEVLGVSRFSDLRPSLQGWMLRSYSEGYSHVFLDISYTMVY